MTTPPREGRRCSINASTNYRWDVGSGSNETSVDLDDAPRLLVFFSSSAAGGGHRERRFLRLGQTRQCIAVNFAREVVFAWRRRPAVQPDPDAKQRIGEAVAFLPRRDEVDILEPRQVILRRA